MFNKKYRELEARIKAIEDYNAEPCDWDSCQACKLHGDKVDFKKVVKITTRWGPWANSKNYENIYYCPKCTPVFDEVDETSEPYKYYKSVAKQKVEVKHALQKK